MGWFGIAGLGGGDLTLTDIVFTNPTVTHGDGLFISQPSTWTATIDNANSASLIRLQTHNTDAAGGSELYTIRIDTETDHVDTGAGLAVINTGQSDNIYLAVAGKASGATAPTGIGVDVNRKAAGENNPLYAGYGIQVWDWSTTNIGGPGVGPTCLFLQKVNNPDTDHVLLYLRANRKAIRITIPNTGSAGYSATQPVFEVTNNAGADLFAITAAGNVNLANTLGIFITGTSGNQAYIQMNAANNLLIRGGAGTTVFRNNADTIDTLRLSDAGNLTFADGATFALGTTTGTKIGTSATQKIGFWNATPIVRPTGWAAWTGTLSRTTQVTTSATLVQVAETLGALINDLISEGLIGA